VPNTAHAAILTAARSFASFAVRRAKIVPELSRNSDQHLTQNPGRLVGRAIEPRQRLTLHVQLHPRALFADLRNALPEEPGHPFVSDSASAQPS
jgi:hypothetical protein